MTQGKNLLLFGSTYPQSIQNDIIDTASELGMSIIPASIGAFKSGERFCELYPEQKANFIQNKDDIAGANVHIVLSMTDDLNALFVDAVNVAATAKTYGAANVHLIMGFAPFARQDREFNNRMVSIMAQTFPRVLKCAGVDRVTTFDVHSKAAEGFFTDAFGADNIRFLSAVNDIYQTVQTITCGHVKYGAPDGADKPDDVAQRKARLITKQAYGDDCDLSENMFGIIKSHTGVNSTQVKDFIGDVTNCDAVELDDMTDTGGTLVNGAHALKQHDAKTVTAALTHGIFSGNSLDMLTADKVDGEANPINTILVTDTILSVYDKAAALPTAQQDRVRIIPTTNLIKQALRLAA